jgi:hypothetical protein
MDAVNSNNDKIILISNPTTTNNWFWEDWIKFWCIDKDEEAKWIDINEAN